MIGFFAEFAPHNAAIVGALAASVAWLFVVAWLMDRDGPRAPRVSEDWLRRRGGRDVS